MSKEEVAKRVEQSLDLFEQGQLIDMVAFGEDVRSLITQSAANKAAEEGGLPVKTWEDRMQESGKRECESLAIDCMLAEIDEHRDRASRQVANKAEVEGIASSEIPEGWPTEIWLNAGDEDLAPFSEYDELSWCSLPQGENDIRYVREDLLDTPPATTGASTSSSNDSEKLIELAEAFAFELSCEDHSNSKLEKTKADLVDYVYSVRNFCADKVRNDALEEAASMLLGGSFLHDKAPSKILAEQAAKAIRALKGSIGASTVLTDERISAMAAEIEEKDDLIARLRRQVDAAVERGVDVFGAAQAGQVAVPAVATQEMITAGKNAWACNYGMAIEEIYAAMLAAAPSPAKESK